MSHNQIYTANQGTQKQEPKTQQNAVQNQTKSQPAINYKNTSQSSKSELNEKNNRQKFAKIFPQAKFEEEDDEALKASISGGTLFEDKSYDYRFDKLIFPHMFKENGRKETISWIRISEIYKNSEYDIFDFGVRDFTHYYGMFERLWLEKTYFRIKTRSDENSWVYTHFNFFNACNLLIKTHGMEIIERIFDEDNSFFKEVGGFKVNLNIGGIWTEYLVDDFMPIKTGEDLPDEFLYSGVLKDCKEGLYEIWLLVLEKAFTKAYNGYERLSDIPVFEFLKSLTGANYELYRTGNANPAYKGYEEKEVDVEKTWEILKNSMKKDHIVSCFVNFGNKRKLRKLETFNNSRSRIELHEGVHYAIESIQEISKTHRYVILETNSPAKIRVPIEEFIRNVDYFNVLKLNPENTYNSVHIPLSNAHYLQSVVKIGIQDKGTYNLQIEQKSPFFYPRSSRFVFNDISITLAYLRENSIEYIGCQTSKGKSHLSFEIENVDEQEIQIIALIDFECNEFNRNKENVWKGDLKHWRDLVFSVNGPEFCTLNSLALDRNRGMVYDFFLHRIWREFGKSNKIKSEGEEIDVKAWEMQATLDDGKKEKIQFMRQGCKMPHLTFFKFSNFSNVQVKLENILDCELPVGLECFGPFEVNNLNPSLVINPNSSDILLFKYNDRISSINKITMKNSGFKVKMTNTENPEDFYGQDPYEHIMKEYKVQSSRTYPSVTYDIPVHGVLHQNMNFDKARRNFKLEEPKQPLSDILNENSEHSSINQEKAPGEELGSVPVKIHSGSLRNRSRSGSKSSIQDHKSMKDMRLTGKKVSSRDIRTDVFAQGTGNLPPSFQVESIKISGIDEIKNSHQAPKDQYGNIGVSFGDCNESNDVFGKSRGCRSRSNRQNSREKRVMFDSLDSHPRGRIFDVRDDMHKRRDTIAFGEVRKDKSENQLLSFGEDLGLEEVPKEIRTVPPAPRDFSKSSSRRITISSKNGSSKNLSKKTKTSGHDTFVNLRSFPSSRSRLESISEKYDEGTSKKKVIESRSQIAKSPIRDESSSTLQDKKSIISEIKEIGKTTSNVISPDFKRVTRNEHNENPSPRSRSHKRSNRSLTPNRSYHSISSTRKVSLANINQNSIKKIMSPNKSFKGSEKSIRRKASNPEDYMSNRSKRSIGSRSRSVTSFNKLKVTTKRSDRSIKSNQSQRSLSNQESQRVINRHTSSKKITITDDKRASLERLNKDARNSLNMKIQSNNNTREDSVSKIEKEVLPVKKTPEDSIFDRKNLNESKNIDNEVVNRRRETANFNTGVGLIKNRLAQKKEIKKDETIKPNITVKPPTTQPQPNSRRHTFGIPPRSVTPTASKVNPKSTLQTHQVISRKSNHYPTKSSIQKPTTTTYNPFDKNSSIKNRAVSKENYNPFQTSANIRVNTTQNRSSLLGSRRNSCSKNKEALQNVTRAITPNIIPRTTNENSLIPKTPVLKQSNVNRVVRLSDKKREKVVITADSQPTQHSNFGKADPHQSQSTSRPLYIQTRFNKGIQPPKSSISTVHNLIPSNSKDKAMRQSTRTRKIILENPLGLSFAQNGKISVRTNINRNSVKAPIAGGCTTPVGLREVSGVEIKKN